MDDKYADLSGAVTPTVSGNPFEALIAASGNDPDEIQARYEVHRRNRNKLQKEKLLDPNFSGADIDQILYKLIHKEEFPMFKDPRHCLVFWARPTVPVKKLILSVQERLLEVLPNLWLMPEDNLHMTAMEIAHSLPQAEIDTLVDRLGPQLEEITNFTFSHRTRLVRPLLGFDASAFALSFVPAVTSRPDHGDANYTYHHLRRDLYNLCHQSGVHVGSRYVIPSAHLTIGRFVTQRDLANNPELTEKPDPDKMRKLVAHIDGINDWLMTNFWQEGENVRWDGAEWVVGQSKGLDCNKGTLWYGYGERLSLGKGF